MKHFPLSAVHKAEPRIEAAGVSALPRAAALVKASMEQEMGAWTWMTGQR